MTNQGRRRAGRTAKAVPRLAVHQEVRFGSAELVPDVDDTDAWLLFIDGVPQSGVDLADPGYLEFEYVRRIAHVADLAFPAGEPLRVLHLGGGALTLPRYLEHTRPGSRQLVAEIDDALTTLVRAHLPLPAGHRIRVRAADARAVVESVREASYDLVIADVFAGRGNAAAPDDGGVRRRDRPRAAARRGVRGERRRRACRLSAARVER